jgi:SHS2 domain-containing protein
MAHTTLSHTADTGIEATAPTLHALIEELALGMFGLMAPVDSCPAGTEVDTTITASTIEDLVVDALSDLLYLAETGDLHFCRFEVAGNGKTTVRIRASGVPLVDIDASGPPIKAVTYHQLEVSERDEGWYARVYFDV